jgi:acyl-coenzyme A synthetase/AMP-(fatty) acid ligase/thioesterase domain-containing protein
MLETAGARERSVSEWFRAVVAANRDRPALEAETSCLTYDELDRASNRVAHALLDEQSDRPLAMIAPLVPASLIVMMGALKAGRLFAPLDPRDPPHRIRLAVDELGARFVEGLDELSGERDDDPCLPLSPGHPALVHFTSGSAGRVTGVIRSHWHLCQHTTVYGITAGDRVGLIQPLAFAASNSGIFGPLLAGAPSCLFDPITRSMGSLAEWIESARITMFQTVPSTLHALAAALDARGRRADSVRFVIVGGEPWSHEQLDAARRVLPCATFANHYASTEASFIAVTRIAPGESIDFDPMSFWQLYPDQTIVIVDDAGHPVPAGGEGEIVVSGPNVALGYCGTPPPDRRPFEEAGPGRRSIQLRDRARLHADGTLELVGRTDLVVKLHGQTVDLEAVERALVAVPGILEAVVSPVPSRAGGMRLVAHMVGAPGTWIPVRDLRRQLSKTLPRFAVPAAFSGVDEIPRNPRGKIDRALLREIVAAGAPPEFDDVRPRTHEEEAISELVAEALGLGRVGVHDDIFELGIDSLTVVGLVEAIGRQLAVHLTAADLMVAPTVADIAALAQSRGRPRHRVVFPVYAGGSGTPLFCVPGGGGVGLLSARRLGVRLRRPTFSFMARGLENPAMPDRTVPQAAARFVKALREVQASGPYLIGGLSFGGLVSFEMARQLEAEGERVALLVLIDPVTRSSRRFARPRQRLKAVPMFLARLAIDRYRAVTAGIVPRTPSQQTAAFLQLHRQMLRRYRPAPYSGRTLILRTNHWQQFDMLDLTNWLAGETRVRTIPGRHITMFRDTNLVTLAAFVREEIAAALPSESTMAGRDRGRILNESKD